jgi:DNA-binding transcriptional LysR family regulator
MTREEIEHIFVQRGAKVKMNLQNLRVFLKVAELEHITRASEELHLTQPAVTKIIQSLESEVHLELVERQGRRIVLTYAGHVLQRHARQLFALERQMEEELAALRDLEGGQVVMAANTTAGVYLLPPIIARFHAQYPRVTLNMAILNSSEIINGTLNWQLDFGLIEGDVSTLSAELHSQVFARDTLILVVAPNHPWSQVSSLRPADLATDALLLREEGSAMREMLEQELKKYDVRLHPLLTLTDNEAIKQMVMNGVAAAVVSSLTVSRELATGALIHVPVEGLELHPELSLIYRVDKQLSRAAHAFCSFLFPAHDEMQVIEV